jgi:hypothetical protein
MLEVNGNASDGERASWFDVNLNAIAAFLSAKKSKEDETGRAPASEQTAPRT